MKAEYLSFIVIAVISFLACAGAGKLGVGRIGSPGPGFFPLVLGGTTGILSLIILFSRLWKGRKFTAAQSRVSAGVVIKVVCILAALVAYGFFVEKIGYVLITFIIFGFLLKVAGTKKWSFVVGGAAVVAVGSYILFSWLLGVSLPTSPFGI
jgi:putative tricarboxylic transport membrane protein